MCEVNIDMDHFDDVKKVIPAVYARVSEQTCTFASLMHDSSMPTYGGSIYSIQRDTIAKRSRDKVKIIADYLDSMNNPERKSPPRRLSEQLYVDPLSDTPSGDMRTHDTDSPHISWFGGYQETSTLGSYYDCGDSDDGSCCDKTDDESISLKRMSFAEEDTLEYLNLINDRRDILLNSLDELLNKRRAPLRPIIYMCKLNVSHTGSYYYKLGNTLDMKQELNDLDEEYACEWDIEVTMLAFGDAMDMIRLMQKVMKCGIVKKNGMFDVKKELYDCVQGGLEPFHVEPYEMSMSLP